MISFNDGFKRVKCCRKNEYVMSYAGVGKFGPYSRAALLASKNCKPAATCMPIKPPSLRA